MDQSTLMEQRLADRGDEEELIEAKFGGVHSTDSRLVPSKLCNMGVSLLIKQYNSKS